MKKIIKISLLLLMLLVVRKEIVYANFDDSFYPGEYIDSEYIKKSDMTTAYYKEHRFILRTSDNQFAYCLEPFIDLKENSIYTSYTSDYPKKLSISKEIWDRVRLISYYGYGYKNHTARKWYTITQIMIWRVVYPNGIFGWTEQLGGLLIPKYDSEIEEINNLVENHKKLPKYASKTYNVSINDEFRLEDTSFEINNYEITNNSNLPINRTNNFITGTTNKEGKYELIFTKKDDRFNNVPIIYTDNSAQNVLVIGNNDPITFKTTINVESGSIKINKLDKDNKSNIPSGSAKIEGTTYGLYNSKKELIKELVINKDGTVKEEKLEYGSYCLKELKSGEGYKIDNEEHCFKINHTKLNIELNLYNEVIKEEVSINKYMEDEENNNVIKESNVKFSIKGINHNYENTIITNAEGYASIILPYGKYLFHQVNTMNNYNKVDDFIVSVDGKIKNYSYELINKKEKEDKKNEEESKKEKTTEIKKVVKPFKEEKEYDLVVPNTSSNKSNLKKSIFISSILSYLISTGIIYYRKIKNNTV